ncbi:zf-TFIIB domain-containing protein [Nocardioides lianchengensis]|uniref:Transcription factor zinc-finger n=1 Tax=Nocardioides lianchengensis TaxID=1045774 RepID=A0A1G6SX92_9ACTN|nr:zf-TFIIB domain-containing protein [Nocardioides lianchengensis]NYG10015.1 Zn-finger nucleic acid-binding protein [Nocardioides lianchengensis]SDD21600.1 Transcription factor zinc-finger [Nocardioides lianchengensis]
MTMSCPQCGTGMVETPAGAASVQQCPEGHGVFLPQAALGALVEAETDWHRYAGQHTAPMPRITPDMEAAPPPTRLPARAWVETLF